MRKGLEGCSLRAWSCSLERLRGCGGAAYRRKVAARDLWLQPWNMGLQAEEGRGGAEGARLRSLEA